MAKDLHFTQYTQEYLKYHVKKKGIFKIYLLAFTNDLVTWISLKKCVTKISLQNYIKHTYKPLLSFKWEYFFRKNIPCASPIIESVDSVYILYNYPNASSISLWCNTYMNI